MIANESYLILLCKKTPKSFNDDEQNWVLSLFGQNVIHTYILRSVIIDAGSTKIEPSYHKINVKISKAKFPLGKWSVCYSVCMKIKNVWPHIYQWHYCLGFKLAFVKKKYWKIFCVVCVCVFSFPRRKNNWFISVP